jgi:hypothetical protein
MAPSCLILPPATPSDLMSQIISNYRYPSTLLIGTSRELFLQSLDLDIDSNAQPQQQDVAGEDQDHDTGTVTGDSQLLRPTLMQIAVSRHIRTVFIPTVVHLRAYLAVFSQEDSGVLAPPNHRPAAPDKPTVLLMYGFLELHRATSEWSAQGLGNSAAALVEAAVRNGFRAVVIDPLGGGGYDTLEQMMSERVPMLDGALVKNDGSWSGRTVDIGRVLGRWFKPRPTTE